MRAASGGDDRVPPGSPGEVFRAFLLLGLTSFGGPIAHLGYFRHEFVLRRGWLSERDYADLVALCQFLPGPASSQVGFALGLMRAGARGAGAAWLAFTLPSAIAMALFALGVGALDGAVARGALAGLKIVAVAVVAHAVWGMARQFCPDWQRVAIALCALGAVLVVSGPGGQVLAIALGALGGLLLRRAGAADNAGGGDPVAGPAMPVSRFAGMLAFLFCLVLLALFPLLAWGAPSAVSTLLDGFYRAGALVFGGGHVVLPLLEGEFVQSGQVSADAFLKGYGAAQAVPGPLFTFAAYIGAVIAPPGSAWFGALLALVMIFLPGLLLLVAALPWWQALRKRESLQALMRGATAAVVGILAAALYQPVWTSAVVGPGSLVLALAGFLLLSVWKLPAWLVVLFSLAGGIAIGG